MLDEGLDDPLSSQLVKDPNRGLANDRDSTLAVVASPRDHKQLVRALRLLLSNPALDTSRRLRAGRK